MSEVPKAPSGWYAHPGKPGMQRYWDGERWTGHETPAPGSGPGVSTIAKGVALGIAAAGLVGVVLWGVAASDDDLDCATENPERVAEGLGPRDC